MKILYDHQIFGWQEYGGISRYFYELAIEMSSIEQQDVSIISPLYVNHYLSQAHDSLKVFGLRMKYLPRTGRVLRTINSILSWPITRYIKPDIFHETYYSGLRLAPRGSKTILTVYDMIHERFSENFSQYDPTSREKAIAVARADHVICISEQTRRDLIEILNVDPTKTSVVHLGFSLTSQAEIKQNIKSQARPFLLYVGNRDGHKNFKGLLQAYAASHILKQDFDMICFGGGAFTKNEKIMLQQLGPYFKNVRHVSGDDVKLAEFYSSASAFIYPSFYEGFGIPPLEAMSFGCPVICSNASSIPEVVGNAGEMFDPYVTDSIRIAIERVTGNDELRRDLIVRGKERVKHFSWKRCAEETLDVYSKVLA